MLMRMSSRPNVSATVRTSVVAGVRLREIGLECLPAPLRRAHESGSLLGFAA